MRSFTFALLVTLISLAIGGAGCLWETRMIQTFEKGEGKSLGLFSTAKGQHYRRWGIEIPMSVTLAALLLYGVLATLSLRRRPHGAIAIAILWCATVLAALGVWYYSALLAMNAEGVVL